jgi:hypothetical protein
VQSHSTSIDNENKIFFIAHRQQKIPISMLRDAFGIQIIVVALVAGSESADFMPPYL